MKKILTVAFVLAAALCVNASELWWTVTDPVDVDGSSTSWNTAQLFANTQGANLNYGGTAVGSAVSHDQMGLFDMTMTDLGKYGSSAYCFYVELYNSSGESVGKTYVGSAMGAVGYDQLKEAGAIYDGVFSPSATPYTGFTQFTTSDVVPEPTSGLLMAFGLMMFALKRKRV